MRPARRPRDRRWRRDAATRARRRADSAPAEREVACVSWRRVPLVKEKVHHHARDRHVEPQREGPARDGAVPRHAHLQPVPQRDDDERHDGDGEDGVGDEDGEVQRPHPPRRGEARDDTVAQEVIRDVPSKEKERGEARREHEAAVQWDVFAPDQDVGNADEDAAGRVEGGVDGGEEAGDVQTLEMYHSDIGSASITLATEAMMAALTIRNLSDEVRDRLRERAAKNGRSMEAEVRAILEAACAPRETMSIEEVQAWVDRLYSG